MSNWTHVIAAYEVNTWRCSKKIRTIVRKIMKHAPEISGSEGPADMFINFPSGFSESSVKFVNGTCKRVDYQTHFVVTISGHLRDRIADTTKNELKRFETFLKSQDWEIVMKRISVEES